MKLPGLAWVVLLAAGVTGHVALAATSANISVTGTIKPPTCTATMNGVGDAVFAYGKISRSRLRDTDITPLEVKSLPLKLSCEGGARLAVSAVDNKTGSNPFITGTVDASDAGETTNQLASSLFGLGTYTTGSGDNEALRKNGGFTLALDTSSAKLNGKPAFMAVSTNNGGVWTSTLYGPLGGTKKTWYTWTAASGSKDPALGEEFEVSLMVKPWIQPRQDLDLSNNILLDGSATLEILYL